MAASVFDSAIYRDLMGDREKAAGYFKQIYQVDIKYRDIADKVEKGYASQS